MTKFNLSAAANYAIIKGLEMMNWASWTCDDRERICAGLYWVNEVIDNVINYPQTRKVWEKVEREFEKAHKMA